MRDSFKEFSYKELVTKREELVKKYRDVRFNVIVGHVDNTLEERILRRKIARLNTLIHEFAIGIRKQ
jgi:large subunit ribosomal protein L29